MYKRNHQRFTDIIVTGISIHEQKITLLRFADDFVLLGGNKNELKDAWN